MRVALSRKVILVEGPSDELVLKKIYMRKFSRMPEQDGIDIIVVRGVGFNTFIEVGKEIGTQIRVLRDNDGDFDTHVVKERAKYVAYPNIRLISSANDKEFSLEPALIHANAKDVATLDAFAKVVLSTQTFKSYSAKATLESRCEFMVSWFASVPGNGKGARKVDAAIKLFDGTLDFLYPIFLDEVFDFAE